MNSVSRPALPAELEPIEELTVNDLIREHPATVEVFNRFGVDACCGGAAPVLDAARRDGVDLATLLAELRRAMGVQS